MEKKNFQNIPSILLNNEENEYFFQLIGSKCKSRSTAVVEVYGTAPPHHSIWDYKYCGVAAFVKDFSRRSFFIQVYDIEVGVILFEQEIYENFYYSVNPLFFHQFESENEIIGLNFANEEEAEHFGSMIIKFTEKKRLKNSLPDTIQEENNEKILPRKTKTEKSFRRSRRLKSRRLSKSQIGEPENFRHIQHVGLDRGGESPTQNLLACFIDMSNIKPKEPEDLYNDIVVTDEIPSIKISAPPYPSAFKPQKHPKTSATVRPTRNPPLAPLAPKPSLKFNRSVSSPEDSLVTIPPSEPPPPPPPPGMQMKHKFVTQRSENPSFNNEYISKNMKTESEDSSSSRSDLLEEIRNPTLKLKHVEKKKMEKSYVASSQSFIMNSLAKTLGDRGFAFRGHSDDSDSDSSYSNDDDDDDSDW